MFISSQKIFIFNLLVKEDVKYDLYAAVMHQGSSSLQGHYYCFVRPSLDSWFIMDDEKVRFLDRLVRLLQRKTVSVLFFQGE